MSKGMRLDEIIREIPGAPAIEGDGAVVVSGVHHDSRAVEPGDLFVVRKGQSSDGARFVGAAAEKGAAAVLVARAHASDVQTPLPKIVVDDVADGLAYAAAAVYGHPAFGMDITGITGTNGKTTTTYLLRAAVDGAIGIPRCGIIGTAGHVFGGETIDASHTTPEADELARVMARMKQRGATHVAMEVSSIALTLGRVRAVRFRVAAFSNLTQDHLDFHGDMRRYSEAKKLLFTELGPSVAVVNVDDPFGEELANATKGIVLRVSSGAFGTAGEKAKNHGKTADICVQHATMSIRGIAAVVKTPDGDVAFSSPLTGAHNVDNLALVLGCVFALDLDVDRAASALASETGAPGRLERCDTKDDDVSVFVDYAHTPDALARALDALRATTKGRILCVFGCGGDRDPTKREPMGFEAASRSDVAIVTNDNPRTEEPEAIARAVFLGVRRAALPEVSAADVARGERGALTVLDRAEAIDLAVKSAKPGDTVLIAGKGHEPYQIVGTTKRHFDDREEARRALEARRGARG
jgi:UDP-N-acetylmuramoyl-L-alanyl-D-glutamate--2,6-diaminopimelate ligase